MRFSGRLVRLQALMVSGGIFSRAKRCCPISMSSVTWWVHYYTQRISVLWAIFLRMCSLCFLQLWHDICVWHVTCVFVCMTCRECNYLACHYWGDDAFCDIFCHVISWNVKSVLRLITWNVMSVLAVFVWNFISLSRIISWNVISCLCCVSLAFLLRIFCLECHIFIARNFLECHLMPVLRVFGVSVARLWNVMCVKGAFVARPLFGMKCLCLVNCY